MKTMFLGEWKLQPEKSEYTHGTPTRKVTYEFKDLSETEHNGGSATLYTTQRVCDR